MTFLFFKTERYLQKLVGDAVRARRTKRVKRLLLTSAICLFLLMFVLALTFSGIGMLSEVEARVNQSSTYDNSALPASVLQDAWTMAGKRYSDSPRAETYYQQVLIAYRESRNKDVLILFNPGGWGTKTLYASLDWTSIIEGMQNDITSAGYRVSTLNYLRTSNNIRGQLNELKEMATAYKSKAADLSELVNFLTRQDPGLKVILAGESTGTIICDEAMALLEDNTRVFSIQTGTPFWHKTHTQVRTILLKDNGIVPDSFSQGDLATILKSSIKSLIELDKPEMEGDILGFLSAPGHEYWWQYPGVGAQIDAFLSDYCELKSISHNHSLK
jgi:hypothetical protein